MVELISNNLAVIITEADPLDWEPFYSADPDDYEDDEDDDEWKLSKCGYITEKGFEKGFCMLAGTEWCDWECPIRIILDEGKVIP